MSTKSKQKLLSIEHFHAVDAETVQQTIEESQLEYSVEMGSFTIHHGTRNGAPILIVEHHNQSIDQLSGIWYDEAIGEKEMVSHIKLDECSDALLSSLGKATGLSIDDIVGRMLGAHLSELHELEAFLEAHPVHTSLHEEGVNLLVSYGPESITAGIKRIAPNYQTIEKRFKQEITTSLHLASENRATEL